MSIEAGIELSWAFERAFHKYAAYESQPRDFGIGFPLTQNEIHAIVIVCENEGISLGELARLRGVTKGVVHKNTASRKPGTVLSCPMFAHAHTVVLSAKSTSRRIFPSYRPGRRC